MLSRLAAAFVVLLALASSTSAQPAADAGLTKGIAQVQDGRWDDAVSTLSEAVKRLSAAPARKNDLAQAYLWLGIAYAQLDSEKSGRASFREALRVDPRVSLAEGWPPKVSRLFQAVRSESALSASSAPAAPSRADAEAMYRDSFRRNPKSAQACLGLAEAILLPIAAESPRFDEGMAVFESCLPLDQSSTPADSYQVVANMYWDRIHKGPTLSDAQKERYADRGLVHEDRALEIKPNLLDAIAYKSLFLRMKASVAKDTGKREALIAEATRLQAQARELRESGKGELSGAYAPSGPPPTPSPSVAGGGVFGGVAGGVVGGVVGGLPGAPPPPTAVRVGGEIKEPRKLKHVSPAYPAIAQSARVQGVVILEVTISPEGKVGDVKVLRGIPLLDAAALDAVRQWVYTPTLLNGVPVPVIMTVTANFRLSDPPPAPASR